MARRKGTPKAQREVVYERVWATEAGDPKPNIKKIIEDVRKAHEAAFKSPGRLTIRGARKHC